MSVNTKNDEKNLESFTASFLLSEFRKDIRSLHGDMNAKIDATNNRIEATNARIDTKFMWLTGFQFVTLCTVIASIFATVLMK